MNTKTIFYVFFLLLFVTPYVAGAEAPRAKVSGLVMFSPCPTSVDPEAVSCLAVPTPLAKATMLATRESRHGATQVRLFRTNSQGKFSLRLRAGSYSFQVFNKSASNAAQLAITVQTPYKFRSTNSYYLELTAEARQLLAQ